MLNRLLDGLLVTSYENRTMNRSPCGNGPSPDAECTVWLSDHHLLLANTASRPRDSGDMFAIDAASTLTMSGAYSVSIASWFLPCLHSSTSFLPTSSVVIAVSLVDSRQVLAGRARPSIARRRLTAA